MTSFLERKRPRNSGFGTFPSARNFRRPSSINNLAPHEPLKRLEDAENGGGGGKEPPSQQQQQTPKTSRGRRFTLVEVKDPMGNWRPSAVELYSRLVFPLAFVAFHIGYWVTCYVCQDPVPEDAIRLVREEKAQTFSAI